MKRYLFDPYTKLTSIVALFFLACSWTLIIWRVLPLQGDITIHYTVHLGIDWIGPSWQALYAPVLGLLLYIFNTVIGIKTIRKDVMFARLVAGFNVFIQALIVFASVILVLANV